MLAADVDRVVESAAHDLHVALPTLVVGEKDGAASVYEEKGIPPTRARLWCAFEILAVGEDTTVLGDVKDCGMRSMVGRKGVENTLEDWALLVRDARVNWLGESGPTGSGSGQGTACRAHPDNRKDGQ